MVDTLLKKQGNKDILLHLATHPKEEIAYKAAIRLKKLNVLERYALSNSPHASIRDLYPSPTSTDLSLSLNAYIYEQFINIATNAHLAKVAYDLNNPKHIRDAIADLLYQREPTYKQCQMMIEVGYTKFIGLHDDK